MALILLVFSIFDFDKIGFFIEKDDIIALSYCFSSAFFWIVSRASWWWDFRFRLATLALDFVAFLVIPTIIGPNGLGYFTAAVVLAAFIIVTCSVHWGGWTTIVSAIVLNISCLAVCLAINTGLLHLTPMGGMSLGDDFRRLIFLALVTLLLVWLLRFRRWQPLIDDLLPHYIDEKPNAASLLTAAIAKAGAGAGAIVWGQEGNQLLLGSFAQQPAVDKDIELPWVDNADSVPAKRAKLLDLDLGRSIRLEKDGTIQVCSPTETDKELLAALGVRRGIWAGLNVVSTQGWLVFVDARALSWDKLVLVQAIANSVERSLTEIHLHTLAIDAATKELRHSIARDLHDSVAQSLVAAQYWLQALLMNPNVDEHTKAEIGNLDFALAQEMRHVRDTMAHIRHNNLEDDSRELAADLSNLAKTLSAYWRMTVLLCDDVPMHLVARRVAFDIQQLVREAVANAVCHGAATQVTIDYSLQGDRMKLTITDNGTGFHNRTRNQRPRSISARVLALGGFFDVRSRPGRTCIEVYLTLES